MKFAFTALLLALAFLAAAISSNQAVELVRPYLEERSEVAAIASYTPIELEGRSYWLVYVTPITATQSKNLVIPVEDEGGFVVTEKSILEKLFLLDYKYDDIIVKLLEKNKLSFNDLSALAQDVNSKTDTAITVIETLKSQVQEKGYRIGFSAIESNLNKLLQASSSAANFFDDGVLLRSEFDSARENNALNSLFNKYNASFPVMLNLVELAEKHVELINEKRAEAINSQNISFEDKNRIVESLAGIQKLGIDANYKNRVLLPAKKEFDSMLARSGQRTQDLIESFLFRKAKRDALNAFETNDVVVKGILANEFDYKACAIEAKELKKAWSEIEALIVLRTREGFKQASQKISLLEPLINSITERYAKCRGIAPTTTPRQRAPDFTPLVIVLILVVAGYAAYWYYRKKKEEGYEY